MKVNVTKEWFAQKVDEEKGLSVEAGMPPTTQTPETDAASFGMYEVREDGYKVRRVVVDVEFCERLETQRDEAREKLADWENAAKHVEDNHPDEVHCGCVPVLRKLLNDARNECDDARRDRDKWREVAGELAECVRFYNCMRGPRGENALQRFEEAGK